MCFTNTYTYLHSTIYGRLSSFAFDRRWVPMAMGRLGGEGGGPPTWM
ncbi:hypothetical protein JMJ77_0000890, partial [Colletotrichum scovillei]